MTMWVLEQHPLTLLGLWLLAGGTAWCAFDRKERRWIVTIAGLGLLGIAIGLVGISIAPPGEAEPYVAAPAVLFILASFWGMIACALIALTRRLLAPPMAAPSRHHQNLDEFAP